MFTFFFLTQTSTCQVRCCDTSTSAEDPPTDTRGPAVALCPCQHPAAMDSKSSCSAAAGRTAHLFCAHLSSSQVSRDDLLPTVQQAPLAWRLPHFGHSFSHTPVSVAFLQGSFSSRFRGTARPAFRKDGGRWAGLRAGSS